MWVVLSHIRPRSESINNAIIWKFVIEYLERKTIYARRIRVYRTRLINQVKIVHLFNNSFILIINHRFHLAVEFIMYIGHVLLSYDC